MTTLGALHLPLHRSCTFVCAAQLSTQQNSAEHMQHHQLNKVTPSLRRTAHFGRGAARQSNKNGAVLGERVQDLLAQPGGALLHKVSLIGSTDVVERERRRGHGRRSM